MQFKVGDKVRARTLEELDESEKSVFEESWYQALFQRKDGAEVRYVDPWSALRLSNDLSYWKRKWLMPYHIPEKTGRLETQERRDIRKIRIRSKQ